jgi:UDP-3-O-[3-hydroxymyristoyl] N-acetylglucosamine deacetylase
MKRDNMQRTIAQPVSCSGIGLHSGKSVNLTILPAPINHGIKFVRTDLPDRPCISARFNKVVDTSLATVIGSEGCIVSTIEHLMAGLAGLGIDNVSVQVDSYELPIMDGSAGPFTRLIKSAGVETQQAPRYYFIIQKPIELTLAEKFVGVYPASHMRITCTIEYDHPLIRTQTFSAAITPDLFEKEIAGARTFGFLHEVERMKSYGLALGGSLDNAVVIDQTSVVNQEGLRFEDEFVRHKLLDCIGDFSLLGLPILGHIKVERSGHHFNHAFLEKFFQCRDAWQTRTVETDSTWYSPALCALAN